MGVAMALLGSCAAWAGDGLSWRQGDGYRFASVPRLESGRVGFTALPASQIGIGFTNRLDDRRSIQNRNLLSGSGVALGDVDGDGLCDLYFCGLDSKNKLYRNLGSWRFEDVTQSAGLDFGAQDSTGAAFADVNGDGSLDLLVNGLGRGTRMFLNDGRGHFRESTKEGGLDSRSGATSLALADIDGDGDLDLYVANFRPTTIKDEQTTKYQIQTLDGRPVVTAVNGRPASLPEYTNRFEFTASGNVLEFGEVDVLYRNDGKGHFEAVPFTGGAFFDEDGKVLTEAPRDWGLAVQFHDFTGDGAPDIYVCNDLFTPDRVWVNNGKGQFRALPRLALRNTSTFSMGADLGDLNRDGIVDLFVVDMLSRSHAWRQTQMADASAVFWPIGLFDNRPQLSRNTLQIGRGDGTFAEIAYFAGLEASEWSWGPIFLDVDLDGYEDILVPNGQLRDFQNGDIAMKIEAAKASKTLSNLDILELLKMFPGLRTPNLIFRNKGDLTFEEVGLKWGFATPGISQGMAVADLDNDGDLDVAINNLNDAPGIYRNDTSAPRFAVRLRGRPPNTRGIGGRIKTQGGLVMQSQEMIAGGRYLSGDDPIRTFAAWNTTNRFEIEVTWRQGSRSVVRDASADTLYEIEEPLAPAAAGRSGDRDPGSAAKPAPLFHDVSDLLRHEHYESEFDDFSLQPLLPNRLSQLGPGICWHDLDQDGFEDLVVGSGRGGLMAVSRNNGKGGFVRWEGPPVNRPVGRDQTTILGFGKLLLAGLANYEDGGTNGGYLGMYDFNRKVSGESILGPRFSVGPMAMADVDGDGDLDLFVGGRVISGRYPEATPSLLMRNEGGRFSVLQRWEKLGMASGAVFSDLDGDGIPELLVATEWGPVRVFKHGQVQEPFEEITERVGLAGFTGWWNGVTTGDFDGDGLLDIVASNWGLNTKYRATAAHPLRIHHGDFSGTGRVDIIESRFDDPLGKEVAERDLRSLSMIMPEIRERFPTLESFGKASLSEVFQDRLKSAQRVEATCLASMVFLNRGGRFEARELPREAQWSPAFAVVVGDCDGDGFEDVFLSQNFFATQPSTSRSDAGRGLWLRGDGKGGFLSMTGQESGVSVYGEQRGAAVADYDGDGRLDLAVSQNGAATRLFQNQGAKPGMRVRLRGRAGNLSGVGAVVRLVYGEIKGPAKEVHAGSGYWSQDSPVLVFGLPREPTGLWIRWPGGATATHPLPKGAREITVSVDAGVERMK